MINIAYSALLGPSESSNYYTVFHSTKEASRLSTCAAFACANQPPGNEQCFGLLCCVWARASGPAPEGKKSNWRGHPLSGRGGIRKKLWLLSRRELNPGLERCYEGLAL